MCKSQRPGSKDYLVPCNTLGAPDITSQEEAVTCCTHTRKTMLQVSNRIPKERGVLRMGLRLIDEQARLPCNKLTEVVCPSIIVRRKKSIESNGVSSYTYINTRASFIFFITIQHRYTSLKERVIGFCKFRL